MIRPKLSLNVFHLIPKSFGEICFSINIPKFPVDTNSVKDAHLWNLTRWNYPKRMESVTKSTTNSVEAMTRKLLLSDCAEKQLDAKRKFRVKRRWWWRFHFLNPTIYHVAEKFGADELWREFALSGMICLCRGMLSRAQKLGFGCFLLVKFSFRTRSKYEKPKCWGMGTRVKLFGDLCVSSGHTYAINTNSKEFYLEHTHRRL